MKCSRREIFYKVMSGGGYVVQEQWPDLPLMTSDCSLAALFHIDDAVELQKAMRQAGFQAIVIGERTR